MAFSRVAALRSSIRASRLAAAKPQLFRHVARRGYASGGHGSAKAGGDAVWAAGAVAVTVPACWYILSNAPDTSHGHDDHGDSHGKEHGEEHEEDDSSEEKKDDSEEKEESKDDGDAEEKSEDGGDFKDDSEAEDKSEKKPEKKSGDEKDQGESVDKNKTKGNVTGGMGTKSTPANNMGDEDSSEDKSDEEMDAETPRTSDDEDEGGSGDEREGNTKKHIPDAKGGNKKRLESNKSIKQGELKESDEGADKGAPSKAPGGKNSQSGKQEGLSNTDTKHSTDISNNPEKSKKAEGGPDTAKVKGSVDPNRKQPENK